MHESRCGQLTTMHIATVMDPRQKLMQEIFTLANPRVEQHLLELCGPGAPASLQWYVSHLDETHRRCSHHIPINLTAWVCALQRQLVATTWVHFGMCVSAVLIPGPRFVPPPMKRLPPYSPFLTQSDCLCKKACRSEQVQSKRASPCLFNGWPWRVLPSLSISI